MLVCLAPFVAEKTNCGAAGITGLKPNPVLKAENAAAELESVGGLDCDPIPTTGVEPAGKVEAGIDPLDPMVNVEKEDLRDSCSASVTGGGGPAAAAVNVAKEDLTDCCSSGATGGGGGGVNVGKVACKG
jgi:hypothetical protein